MVLCVMAQAQVQYVGRVTTEMGEPISYATIYPVDDPIAGTATNDDGIFRFKTGLPQTSQVIVSFIGYEKKTMPLSALKDSAVIVLHEQPIALEETIVAAKPSRQRNKKKQISSLLHSVYVQMDKDFSDEPYRSRIVSDIRMDSEGEAWGMEQMIATITNLPGKAVDGKDSIQFVGECCKRYFKPAIRSLVDTMYKEDGFEHIDKKLQKAAVAIDSGVIMHWGLWKTSNIRWDFEENINDTKHWTVSNESEGETVLTHTEKTIKYLGIFRYYVTRNYILDSKTLSVRRYSERLYFAINIPFGYKLKGDLLNLLNLINMSDKEIEKFRLRKANATIQLNTIYHRQNGHLYPLEKNMVVDANVVGTRDMAIPVQIRATQRVTTQEVEGVKPISRKQITKRVKRQIVELY